MLKRFGWVLRFVARRTVSKQGAQGVLLIGEVVGLEVLLSREGRCAGLAAERNWRSRRRCRVSVAPGPYVSAKMDHKILSYADYHYTLLFYCATESVAYIFHLHGVSRPGRWTLASRE